MNLEISAGRIIAFCILLLISAFASSSETAFFSLNRFQLRKLRERHRRGFERIRKLLNRPSRLLVMILLINEIVNISISGFVAEQIEKNKEVFIGALPWLSQNLTPEREWFVVAMLSLFITLPVLVLVGEITPKVIAAKMNRIVTLVNSHILIWLYRLLFPLLWVIDAAISLMLKRFKAEGKDHLTKAMSVLSEDDFVVLMEEGHREGTVDPDERKLIKNVLELDDSTVLEVMTPITQAFCLSGNSKVNEVLGDIRSQKYSRIPVYQKSRKHIIGILYVKDLLALRAHPNLQDIEVKSLITKTISVNPEMRLSVLFRKFKNAKTHMAICIDRNEDAIGVVTMEDVLESIFGEIEDERDVR